MPAAQQLTTDNYGGLDIAATSVARQHKFHLGFGLSVVRVGNVGASVIMPGASPVDWAFGNWLG
jgi:hypothetical protein